MKAPRKSTGRTREKVSWTQQVMELFTLRRTAESASPAPVPVPVSLDKPEQSPRGLDPALTVLAADWAREAGAVAVAARLRVVWNPRLQTTAGTARPATGCIELNPRLHEVGPGQVQRTLKHEVAHLIAHWRSGRRRIEAHGMEWRQACHDLGIPDEKACHNLPFPRRAIARKLTYQCPGCAQVVHRVRKFARFTACYQCCRLYSGGKYDERFQFVRVTPER